MERTVISTAHRTVLRRASRGMGHLRPESGEAMRVDTSAEPEQMIAALRTKRTLMMLLALGGIAVVLGVLFSATGAMYAKDPIRDLQTEKAALEAAP
jgi:hypothetical protein